MPKLFRPAGPETSRDSNSRPPQLRCSWPALVLMAIAVPFLPATAATDTRAEAPREASEAAASRPIEEITILSSSPSERAMTRPRRALESGRAGNLSEALRSLPGVDGVKRGALGIEPVVRGLGWERVPVEIGGLSVQGAGPARMDTPAALFGPSAIVGLELVKGLPSVTLGPGGSGGRIRIDTNYERSAPSGNEIGGRLQGHFSRDRDAFSGSAILEGGTTRFDLRAGVDGRHGSDHRSAGGVDVPAGGTAVAGALSLGFRVADAQRLSASFIDSEYWDTDFPSLPMDSDSGWARVLDTDYRWKRDAGALRESSLHVGFARARHEMSNRRRASWAGMQMQTEGLSDSIHVGLDSRWQACDAIEFAFGAGFDELLRDALRQRAMRMPTGMWMRRQDRLWPDVEQWNLGVYGEARTDLGRSLSLRIGARIDEHRSDARAADETGFAPVAGGARSVREWYVFFYGPAAGRVERSLTLGSGNARIQWRPDAALQLEFGAGLVSRAPAATERYFSLAPAPGGYQVGNPDLDPELRSEIEAGADFEDERVQISVRLYHRWFRDYVLPVLLQDDQDIDGVPGLDVVRGFRNVNARMYGAELDMVLQLGSVFSLSSTLSYVRGRNTSDGRDLPEIPPFEAGVALRAEAGRRLPWWIEFGGRFAGKQDRIDRQFGENATDSHQRLHLRGGLELFEGVHAAIGLENLLDQDYHEHLTREAAAPVGDLAAGDEIPEAGRSVHLTLRGEF